MPARFSSHQPTTTRNLTLHMLLLFYSYFFFGWKWQVWVWYDVSIIIIIIKRLSQTFRDTSKKKKCESFMLMSPKASLKQWWYHSARVWLTEHKIFGKYKLWGTIVELRTGGRCTVLIVGWAHAAQMEYIHGLGRSGCRCCDIIEVWHVL